MCPHHLAPLQAAAAEGAGSALQRQLAALPCANVACCALAGASEAALPSRRCSCCRVARFCSTLCSKQAWKAGHRAACADLAAAAAAQPEHGPPSSTAVAGQLPPGKLSLQCPVCCMQLAVLAGDGDGGAAHMQACAQARQERCATLRAAHGGDPAAAAAALPEVVWLSSHLQYEEVGRADMLARVQELLTTHGAGQEQQQG